MPPLYKKTTSINIPELTYPKKSSLLIRNASLINRFNKLRWAAFRIPLVTAKPTRTPVCSDRDEHTKAFMGLLSYFLP